MSRTALAIIAALVIGGCAGQQAFREGQGLIESGQLEQGLARVHEASLAEPHNQEYRAYYFRQRDVGVQRLLALAERARFAGALAEAESAYQRALALDAANQRALAGLEGVQQERRHRASIEDAEALLGKGDAAGAEAKAKDVLAENPKQREALALMRKLGEQRAKSTTGEPRLAAALNKRISLEFRDAGLRQVFDLISKNTGINFVLDRDVRPDLRATLSVENSAVEDVIRFLLVTNQLERKVLNEKTLLIYPNTPAKTREYRDMVVRTFYLTNADVKQTANMIRALVKTRDLFIDEKLNLLVMRDTPDAVRMAERLVANQDLGEPEVMLEVEVLEVGTTLLTQMGVQWPSQLSYGLVGAAGVPGQLTLSEWLHRSSGLVRMNFSDPLFALSLLKQDGSTNLLANPRIRVKNRDKARIHIGDKVPVITTTTTATGFVAESVTYLDVGLKLEVEPTVFLDNDVGIKVGLEVSSISQQIRSASGTVTYQLGTRNASTTLRLRDGETQVLAGLINDEDRRTANKVPGLGDLPVVGHLFSNRSNTANKTEIILLITPYVVRNLARPEVAQERFSGGTDAELGGSPLALPGMGARPAIPEPISPFAPIPGASQTPAPAATPSPAPAPGAAPQSTPTPTPMFPQR